MKRIRRKNELVKYTIQFFRDDLEKIKIKAREENISVSEYIRRLIGGKIK